jgi:hypothetical protein
MKYLFLLILSSSLFAYYFDGTKYIVTDSTAFQSCASGYAYIKPNSYYSSGALSCASISRTAHDADGVATCKLNTSNIISHIYHSGSLFTTSVGCSDYSPCTPDPAPEDPYFLYEVYSNPAQCISNQNNIDPDHNSSLCHWDTCADDLSNVDASLYVTPNACIPINDNVLSLSKTECESLSNSIYMSSNTAYKISSATFQDCDNTCYGLEAIPATCDEIFSQLQKTCDLDLNDLKLDNCIPDYDLGLTSYTSLCTPKNQNQIKAPCETELETTKQECESQNKVLSGKCEDNGLMITLNTLDCIAPPLPDCDYLNEHLDLSTNQCVCDEDFTRDNFGNCNIYNDPETNQSVPQMSPQDSQNLSNTRDTNENTEETNNKLDDALNDLTRTNNSLSGIRNDLNTTNNLLNSIKDSISEDPDTDSLNDQNQQDYFSQSLDILQTVQDGFNTIQSDFESMKQHLGDGYTVTSYSSGCYPEFKGTVFGKEFKLDLGSFFTMINSVTYFIFFIIFTFIGLRLFYFGLTLGLR